MRISRDTQELAERKFNRRAEKIIAEFHRPISTNGARRYVDSRRYPINKLNRLASAWLDIWTEAFELERLVPDDTDMEELKEMLRQMIKQHSQGMAPVYIVGAETPTSIFQSTYEKLQDHVEAMEIKNRNMPPTVTYNHLIVEGDNNGNIQQGGQGNTQNNIKPKKPEVSSDEDY